MKKEESDKLNESMGRLFYAMLSTMSGEIIKSKNFPEEMKKDVFDFTIRNYADLPEEEKRLYVVCSFFALSNGMMLMDDLVKNKVEDLDEIEKHKGDI